jgi:small conductance mechanosensitive channel
MEQCPKKTEGFLLASAMCVQNIPLLAQRSEWVAGNAFPANLISGAIGGVAFVAGMIPGLRFLDATALLSHVLVSTGITGFALGFAIRPELLSIDDPSGSE